MSERLQSLSLSYKKAPFEIREKLTLSEGEIKDLYIKFKDVLGIKESLIISTCNRTEVYFRSADDISADLIRLLASVKAIDSSELEGYFEVNTEERAALTYLFEVALGLHSQVVGDQQIINQVKQAYQWAADMDMTGTYLHRVMHTIFFANKRVVQETEFHDGAASTSYATIDLMQSILPAMAHPRILVLGLGEMGEDVAKTLFEKDIKNVTLCNRSKEKAEALAELYQYDYMSYFDLINRISEFDIIISSLRLMQPIITKSVLSKRQSITYCFDLSIPHSIHPEVAELPGVVFYGLDEIQQITDESIDKRLAAVPAVKGIIEELVEDIDTWSKELQLSPTIHKLKNALEQIRQEEMAKHLKGLTEEEAKKVEKITSGMMQKIIKMPVLQLKAACKRGEAEELIDFITDLFDLEKTSIKA
ncbi:glutamyl-tRNA reductase [Leadbetterella byssophila]|uniref:Glutamyl-tRNA reductase n=1 Tax=Leadbetterella byssophila (strain DSM 17132 / JCM 16389 / KACC 11308 / NBRC 106382 / 4M15) TaxID=649349 RepID=E4RQW9_LEAB4|nr:glutamyl-tRNA reductase [Leadbetterella byssophila]ADQ18412.1 glutamyl-tRNA reductase [Leadbetterella byssophila DSM 17132]